jgi:hypothetical protein
MTCDSLLMVCLLVELLVLLVELLAERMLELVSELPTETTSEVLVISEGRLAELGADVDGVESSDWS